MILLCVAVWHLAVVLLVVRTASPFARQQQKQQQAVPDQSTPNVARSPPCASLEAVVGSKHACGARETKPTENGRPRRGTLQKLESQYDGTTAAVHVFLLDLIAAVAEANLCDTERAGGFIGVNFSSFSAGRFKDGGDGGARTGEREGGLAAL